MQALTTLSRNILSTRQPALYFKNSKRFYSATPLIGKYKTTEVELFRLQRGAATKLRDFEAQKKKNSKSYDLVVQPDGLVHPKTSELFEGPNGASLRPIGPFLFELVAHWSGKDLGIYRIPKGTKLPDNLILLHEHSDHYSLQTTKPVKLSALNKQLTEFFNQFERLSAEEFQTRFSYVDSVRSAANK